MSKCSRFAVRFQMTMILAIMLALPALSFGKTESARLATFDSSTGETSFALSLTPHFESKAVRPSHIVIYFDTSASQTGAFRADGLAALNSMLSGLDPSDRVQLFAIDIDAVPLTDQFVAADSPQMEAALKQLNDRVPLGSTDMTAIAESSVSLLGNVAKDNRNVIYIGDGISRSGLIADGRFEEICKQLVNNRISVSSYAIGPERDVELLAALANHTGGNVFIDSDDIGAADRAAAGLLTTVRGSVFWPSSIELPNQIAEVFPKQTPPLRSDRDTVLIGTLTERVGDLQIKVTGEIDGQQQVLSWPVSPEQSQAEFEFLPKLLDMARENQGITLPTVGSAGLREAARVIMASSKHITQLGASILAASATTETEVPDEPPASPAEVSQPATEPTTGGIFLQDTQSQVEQESAGGDEFLNSIEARKQAGLQRLQAHVANEIRRARELMSSKPEQGIERLKAMLDTVQRAPDVDPQARLEFENQLRSALRQANVSKQDFDARVQEAQRNEAISRDRLNMLNEFERREELLAQQLNQFNALMDERNYDGALDVVNAALDLAPNNQHPAAAEEVSIIKSNWEQYWELRERKNRNFLANLYETEAAAVAFSGNPPLVFPDAEEWARKKELRAKWQSVRLLGNEREEAILRALESDAKFDYFEQRFGDVIDELKTDYNIPIVLDESARENNLDEDTLITLTLSGISLRSGLRIMLKPYQCTYVVKDEVLYIMSEDAALDNLVINIYNVGDLVAPRGSFGGGFGGGGGGFGGGGGRGGGGGGFGGGGGGFGGGLGGGAFCVTDELPLGSKKDTQKPTALTVEATDGQSVKQAWNQYFATHYADPADVRETVRQLLKQNKSGEIVSVIEACMRNDQTQPWMYEAAVLAMQISEASPQEIERTVMSSVDFSDNVDDLMQAALFMTNNKMEKRALQILKDISTLFPARHEPYAVAMRAAKKIDDRAAIKWATLGVLSQEWPEHPEQQKEAFRTAEAIKLDLQREGKLDELREFNKDLAQALYRDCVIKVTWTGDADLDLYVEEPGGTICSRENLRTLCGGIMMGDQASRRNESGQVSEHYVLPKGFSGDYRMAIRRVWGTVPTGKVTVEVFRNYRTDHQTSMKRQIQMDDKGAIVLFRLDEGRRTERLNRKAIETAAAQEFIADRGMMARDLAAHQSSSASRHYRAANSEADPRLAQNNRLNRRDSGFQPIVEQFFVGTGMTTQATTADRLYVLVSTPFQLFSDITEVSTFNFVTGETGVAGGGAGGVGGAGGGAGGGGAGGFGGGGVGN